MKIYGGDVVRILRKSVLLDWTASIFGGFLGGLSVHVFTAPNHIAPGGMTGLATLSNYLFGVPIGVMILLFNLPLFLLGLKFLGKNFMIKTIISTALLSLMIDVVVKPIPVYHGNPMLAALFGGVLMGIGLSLIFMRGSCTGGTDLASKLIQRKLPFMQMGKLMLMIDFVIVAFSAAIYKNIESGLYAIISLFASSMIIDSILYGVDEGRMVLVMSEKTDLILDKVINQINRGATILKSRGAYSGKDQDTLLIAVTKLEYYKLKQAIYLIDPYAFIIVTEAGQVLGLGFKPIDE